MVGVFILLTVCLLPFATGDEQVLKKAKLMLLKHTGKAGPDEKFIEKVVDGMELLAIRRAKFGRKGTENKKENEDLVKKLREIVGPKDNKTDPIQEAHPDLEKVALEGDMIMTPDQIDFIINGPVNSSADARKRRSCTTDAKSLWSTDQPIAYQIDASLNSVKDKVLKAIQFWSDNSCLSFEEDANAFNRLRIYKGSGCWSYIGKQTTWESQDVSIGGGCESLGTICHEMAHALGFFHTQSRYDRDTYLTVNMANIQSALQYNFDKMTSQTETHFDMQYDYGSVMQYNPYAFAIDYSKPTSMAKDMYYQNMMGQRDAPAFSDIKQMNLLYKCAAKCQTSLSCQNSGIVNPKTCNSCICPRYFGGNNCGDLAKGSAPVCNGATVQATASFASLNATVGNGMTYKFVDEATDCYWLIQAPAGKKIQIQVTSLNTNCMESCNWAGFEINMGKLEMMGILTCCPSIYNVPFTSTGNIVAIRGLSRFNDANLVLKYKIV